MKQKLFLSLAVGVLGVVMACSQADKHPANLGDCDVCSTPNVPVGSTDSGTDASVSDAKADGDADAALLDSASDALVDDAATLDGAQPDAIVDDAALLDSASE